MPSGYCGRATAFLIARSPGLYSTDKAQPDEKVLPDSLDRPPTAFGPGSIAPGKSTVGGHQCAEVAQQVGGSDTRYGSPLRRPVHWRVWEATVAESSFGGSPWCQAIPPAIPGGVAQRTGGAA
jgi:hypothetical protein